MSEVTKDGNLTDNDIKENTNKVKDVWNSSADEAVNMAENETAIATAIPADSVALPVSPVITEYKKRKGFKYGCYLFIKRAFDIVSSGLLFLILSPLILILLLIKWLEDFHNPVYVSWRVGKDGKPFKIHMTAARAMLNTRWKL